MNSAARPPPVAVWARGGRLSAEQSSSNETAREHLGQPTPALPIDQAFTIPKWMVLKKKKKGIWSSLALPALWDT